jgi:hypothetical protein
MTLDLAYLFECITRYFAKNECLPALDRSKPPLFLYLEIIRYLHSKKVLDLQTQTVVDDIIQQAEGSWENQLTDAEVQFWYSNLFPWGYKYLQKKSKCHHNLVTYFRTGQTLTLPLLKEYTQTLLKNSKDADE